jgi:serine/threonine protein kinase HipA of HipAB toxin-antitoxin module
MSMKPKEVDEGEAIHAALDLLREFCPLATQVVDMVDRREEVVKALELLSKLDRWLLVRWSDSNYG